MRIIDATCPHVAHVQSLIRYHTGKGYDTIIVGSLSIQRSSDCSATETATFT